MRSIEHLRADVAWERSLRLTDTPIYGAKGVSLDELWREEPAAYMSICPAEMPNFFLFVGPNGAPGAGSTIHMSECVAEYMIKCIKKLQRENLRWMQPKPKAVRAWIRQVDRYFEKTTFAFTCSNWAKRTANGRMIGYWPGSSIHQRLTLENPRFEDFEYQSFESDGEGDDNSLAWIGNGMAEAQMHKTSTTWYLDTVDIPPLPVMIAASNFTPPTSPGHGSEDKDCVEKSLDKAEVHEIYVPSVEI